MNYHPTDRHYTTRSGAREAARRLFKKTNGLLTINGVTREWDMDCVAVYAEGREWTFFISINEAACPMAEVKAQEQEKAQEEVPRELAIEQALEIATQHTEAVDEEFHAVEARRKAEAEQKDEALQRLAEFNQCDMDIATSMGRDALETAISRMEDAVQLLKRRLADFNDADRAGARANYLSWAANDLRNADFNDMRLLIAEHAGMLKALGAARVHIEHFSEK